jgi:hypothetical protein
MALTLRCRGPNGPVTLAGKHSKDTTCPHLVICVESSIAFYALNVLSKLFAGYSISNTSVSGCCQSFLILARQSLLIFSRHVLSEKPGYYLDSHIGEPVHRFKLWIITPKGTKAGNLYGQEIWARCGWAAARQVPQVKCGRVLQVLR